MEDVYNYIKNMAELNMGTVVQFLRREKNKKYKDFILNNVSEVVKNMNFGESELLYYFLNKTNEIPICLCGSIKKYSGPFLGYKQTCGKKECYVQSRKNTSLLKYGVENPMQSEKIIKKAQETILQKYNGQHYMKDEKIIKKVNDTMIKKYGVKWASQSKEVQKKIKKTWNSNPKKDEIIKKRSKNFKKTYDNNKEEIDDKKKQTKIKKYGSLEKYIEHCNEKTKETSLKKYGVDHHFKSEIVKNKRKDSYIKNTNNKIIEKLLDKPYNYVGRNESDFTNHLILNHIICKENFNINRLLLEKRILNKEEICTKCNPIITGTSKIEKEFIVFLKSLNDYVISNTKNIINPYELDAYVPNLKLGFEFNGLYWHSELEKNKNFHKMKTELCEKKDIRLIHLYEDDWIYRREIVESRIKNLLNLNHKIYARKCVIKIVNYNKTKEFLIKNHIQGHTPSKINYGLYYNDELVSIMTFGNLRRITGKKHIEGHYEMLRFCNKLNTNVIGGASRLFKKFIIDNKPKEILSYADRSWSIGNLYKTLGFTFQKNTNPNYWWVIDDSIREHRYKYRKSELVKKGYDKNLTEFEIMMSLGHYRIWDSGSQVWIYQK